MTHLQELFGSFPCDEIDGDKAQENGSEEEYHIYEEDSDNYSEEWLLTFRSIRHRFLLEF